MRPDSLLRSAGIGIVAALVAVVIVFLIADAASGPLLVTQPGADAAEEAPLAGAIVGVIFGGIVGTGLAVLARRLPRSMETFVGICLVGLVLYGVFALSASEAVATGIWLNVMHVVAAVPIVGLLARWVGAAPAPDAAG